MRILVADDHGVIRKGIIYALQAEYPDAEFVEAENGNQAVNRLCDESWDILILDISMPERNGIEVLKDRREFAPNLPVLVLSMHPESQFGVSAMRAGASGYLNKCAALERLVEAVQCILAGGKYISPELERKLSMLTAGAVQDTQNFLPLSERETSVMKLLYEGHALKEISAQLDLSPKTIATYRKRILEKLGVNSNAQLVKYILENKVL